MPSYIAQDAAVCGSCAHFRQPFVQTGTAFAPIDYGHCVYPRLKKRTMGETCPYWAPRPTKS